MNVTDTVTFAAGQLAAHPELRENGKRDATLLLMHALNWRREMLLANPQQEVLPEDQACFEALIAQRLTGKPIQYITGVQQFWGMKFAVTPAVLIPRPETEHLVEAALEHILPEQPGKVIDVGTGSGAIAIALAHERSNARILAIDVSAAALAVARRNAEGHQVANRIEFREGDLLTGIAEGSADMIVSNPPYVAAGERESLAVEVRDYEPEGALFAGVTGYEVHERLIAAARRVLKENGRLLLEIGQGQRAVIHEMLEENGYMGIRFIDDLQQIPRVAVAQAQRANTGPSLHSG